MKTVPQTNTTLSGWVKSILQSKGLTLHQVSEESARHYGRSSPSFIQHNFYHALRSGAFTPSLLQVCALSRISGYHLHDWLTVFGFDLERIPHLQAILPSKRTILLDTGLQDNNARVPWFRDFLGAHPPDGIVPLSRLLEFSGSRRLGSLSASENSRSLYAKIGVEDAVAFPDLLPGSIVRVNTGVQQNLKTIGKTSDHIFLIQHNKGLWCSRLHFSGEHQIHPMSNQLAFARVELQIPAEARILGFVDLEIRRVGDAGVPEVPIELARQWKPGRLGRRSPSLGDLIWAARRRAALSLREASAMSRKIADLFGDERYFAAPGSLSDYETQTSPPRHIHKVITLCMIYGVPFADLLNLSGVAVEGLGRNSIPSTVVPISDRVKTADTVEDTAPESPDSILRSLMMEFGDFPFFLRRTLAGLSGIKRPSLHDLFYVGPESSIRHSFLRGALLLVVDRHRKKPLTLRSIPLRRQPLYLLMTRDGRYVCGCCSLENGILVVTFPSADFHSPERFRNHDDAEVVGEVVTTARRLV
jgi:hypothetical protein